MKSCSVHTLYVKKGHIKSVITKHAFRRKACLVNTFFIFPWNSSITTSACWLISPIGRLERERERGVLGTTMGMAWKEPSSSGDASGNSSEELPSSSSADQQGGGVRRFPTAAQPEIMRAAEKDEQFASFINDACRDAFRHLFGLLLLQLFIRASIFPHFNPLCFVLFVASNEF